MAQHPIAIPDEATYAGIRSFGCSISTTLRRTCGGHHRHLHGKRNQDRLVENSMLNGGKLPHGIALDLTYLI